MLQSPHQTEATTSFEQSPYDRITGLRAELEQRVVNPESIQELNQLVHGFIVDDIAEAAITKGQGQAVSSLLAESAPEARVNEVKIVAGPVSSMAKDGTMRLSEPILLGDKSIANVNRFQFKHPGDQRLLQTVQVVSHELAHNIIHGAERTLSPAKKSDLFKSYLLRHPVDGFTGNLNADRNVTHERFAEGGRLSALKKTMELLGYEPHEVNHYLQLVAHTPELRTINKKGDSPVDVLSRVTATKGPDVLVSTQAHPTFKVKGYLGYTKPLTPEQSADILYDVATQGLIDGPDRYAQKYFAEQKHLHAATPEAEVPAYIRLLKQIRKEDLESQSEIATSQAIGRLVAKLTGTTLARDLLSRKQQVALRNKFPVAAQRSFVLTQQTSAAHPEGPHYVHLDQLPPRPTNKIKL